MSSKSKKQKVAATATWFEVVAHSDALAKNVVEIPDGQRYTVRGPIHDVMIITIPQQQIADMINAGTFDATMSALGTTVRGGGFEGGLLIVPEGLGYMRLQPVDRITSRLLEQRDMRQRAEHEVKVAKIKAEQDDERSDEPVTELRPDTKTVGEA
jgi:hypothetical protein